MSCNCSTPPGCQKCKERSQSCKCNSSSKTQCNAGYCGVAPRLSCAPCMSPNKCGNKHDVKKNPCDDGVKISQLPTLDFPECGDWMPITHNNTTMKIDWCTMLERIHEYLIDEGCCGGGGSYSNVAYCKKFRKNNCEPGFMGTIVNVCVDAGEFTSTVSQADADAKAVAWVAANGQDIANDEGDCIPAKTCPGGFEIGGQTLYQSTRIVLNEDPGTVRFLLGTYEQADSFDIYYGDDLTSQNLLWSSKSLPTANASTGMVATTNISKNNYNNGAYIAYKPCDNEIEPGNNQLVMYDVVVTFEYNPTNPDINFVTLVTQAPEAGTRWSYKMGCPCNGTTPPGTWNYCQDCSGTQKYYSQQFCETVQKNDCPSGQTGSLENVCVAAGQFESTTSQADANSKAQTWLNANKQSLANSQGTCTQTQLYYNDRICEDVRKNDCPNGETGSLVNVCIAANTHSSTISKADANAKAQADFDNTKQTNANDLGTCIPDAQTYWNLQKCQVFVKNDCPPNENGSSENICVAANTFSSTVSQADADNKAIAYLTANGQTEANNQGTCTPGTLYENVKYCETFYKSDCDMSSFCRYMGKAYEFCVEAGKYTSTISQTEADNFAITYVQTNGQNEADVNGECEATDTNPVWNTIAWNCSTSNITNTGSGGDYYWREIEQQNDCCITPPKGTTQWERWAANDGACDSSNVDPVWQFESVVCSCNADSVSGNNEGDYAFKYEKQVNINCPDPAYGTVRGPFRDSTLDGSCPISEGQWIANGTMCEGTTLKEKLELWKCGVNTGQTKAGSTIQENATSCGYTEVVEWRADGYQCIGTTKTYYERKYVNGVATSERRESNVEYNSVDCGYDCSVWAYKRHVCSCNADSISGNNEGNYAFKWEYQSNASCSTTPYGTERGPFRDSAYDNQCPISEGQWVFSDIACNGYNRQERLDLYKCGQGPLDWKWGAVIEVNSTACGYNPTICNNIGYTETRWRECPVDTEPSSDAFGTCSVAVGEVCGLYGSIVNANQAAKDQAIACAQAKANQAGTCNPIKKQFCNTNSGRYTRSCPIDSKGPSADAYYDLVVGSFCGQYYTQQECNDAAAADAQAKANQRGYCIYCNDTAYTKKRSNCASPTTPDPNCDKTIGVGAICGNYGSVDAANADAENIAELTANNECNCIWPTIFYELSYDCANNRIIATSNRAIDTITTVHVEGRCSSTNGQFFSTITIPANNTVGYATMTTCNTDPDKQTRNVYISDVNYGSGSWNWTYTETGWLCAGREVTIIDNGVYDVNIKPVCDVVVKYTDGTVLYAEPQINFQNPSTILSSLDLSKTIRIELTNFKYPAYPSFTNATCYINAGTQPAQYNDYSDSLHRDLLVEFEPGNDDIFLYIKYEPTFVN